MSEIKKYKFILFLTTLLSFYHISLGEILAESDLGIFESKVHHVSFHYPKNVFIPQKYPPQINMTYRFQSSLNNDTWLTVRFIPHEQASSLSMVCKKPIKAKELKLDCETISLSGNTYAYVQFSSRFQKSGKLSAIAWVEYSDGGIIDIQLAPMDESQKQIFRDIIKSIKFL